MALQAFSFPLPKTRFIKAGSFIYKFEIRGGSSHSVEDSAGGTCLSRELEQIIRTVLCNLDRLQPFSSPRFNVVPYKRIWKGASEELGSCCRGNLRTYAFVIVLHLESNKRHACNPNATTGKQAEEKSSPEEEAAHQIPSVSEPPSKRPKKDTPLEGAIIKHLIKDMEAESGVSVVRLQVNDPSAEDEVNDAPGHADEKRTAGFEEPQQKSGVSGAPSEVHPGTHQDVGEEEGDEDGGNVDSTPETPEEPGMLTRLARRIFPFSLFVKNP